MLDIREREYQSPTPIQAQGMPIALMGRDILGCAGVWLALTPCRCVNPRRWFFLSCCCVSSALSFSVCRLRVPLYRAAETGSGKTASFAIPMIQHCLQQGKTRRGDGPIGLVLAPTRELAQQVSGSACIACRCWLHFAHAFKTVEQRGA